MPLPRGWWGWGEWAPLGENLDHVPNPIGFRAPFSCIPISWSCSSSAWCFVREPGVWWLWPGELGRDCDPLTTQAKANLPTCVSPAAGGCVCRLSMKGAETMPHLFFSRGIWCCRGEAEQEGSAWGIPPISPCWSGAGSQNLCVLALAGTFGVTPIAVSPVLFVPPPCSCEHHTGGQPLKETCPVSPVE